MKVLKMKQIFTFFDNMVNIRNKDSVSSSFEISNVIKRCCLSTFLLFENTG